eukprot:1157900-Amorphochlora_amoeboformis.AAC.1
MKPGTTGYHPIHGTTGKVISEHSGISSDLQLSVVCVRLCFNTLSIDHDARTHEVMYLGVFFRAG